MSGLIGEKLGMSQIIQEDGKVYPVTYVSVTPNVVTHIKTVDKDGYDALVLGCKQYAKPSKTKKFTYLREFRVENIDDYKKGDVLTVDTLKEVESVSVTGTSKGKGFQGVIKRYGFRRGPQSHGSGHNREPGSVGGCAKPGRIKKGKKLPGRMGGDTVTRKKCDLVAVDSEKNIIAIKGPLPGSKDSCIIIRTA